jgi:hypothetical protein
MGNFGICRRQKVAVDKNRRRYLAISNEQQQEAVQGEKEQKAAVMVI